MPRRAEITFVGIQDDPGFNLPDVGRFQRVLLGPKDGFWRTICPPMGSKGQSARVAPPTVLASRSIVAPAHTLHFDRESMPPRPLGGVGERHNRCRATDAVLTRPDAPRSDGGGKGVESGAPGRMKPTRIAPRGRMMEKPEQDRAKAVTARIRLERPSGPGCP